MTAEQYIKTLPDSELILAYIACAVSEGIEGTEGMDADINNDEYEDVKDQVDTLIEQARDRAYAPYKIENEDDAMKYFDDCYGEFIEDDPDIQEERKRWERNPWGEFIDCLNEFKDYYKNSKWYEHNGYYFMVGVW